MTDDFENIVKEVEDLVDNPNFIWIKRGDQSTRLFKSLNNGRVLDETFDEYKLRLNINRKMIKKHKRGFTS
jgi:hypothetical protein